ncbi:MAG: hypothetical protein FJ225_01350 [Lentisphaerae bacterium]|nr:hypothetical protein [Lentisphaerota bacterium]
MPPFGLPARTGPGRLQPAPRRPLVPRPGGTFDAIAAMMGGAGRNDASPRGSVRKNRQCGEAA